MPTSSGRRFQEFRNAKACLDKVQHRLRKGGRRWPFEQNEFTQLKQATEARALEILGPVEFARVQNEVQRAVSTGKLKKGTRLSELDAMAAEQTTTRLAIAKTEDAATNLISELRKHAKKEGK